MTDAGPRRRRGRILLSILALLFAIGVVPLVLTSYRLVSQSRDSLVLTQREMQQDKARSLTSQVELYVRSLHDQVSVIARTLENDSGRMPFEAIVARLWVHDAL